MAKKEPWTTRCMYVSERAKCETVTPRQWSHCVRLGSAERACRPRLTLESLTETEQRLPLGGSLVRPLGILVVHRIGGETWATG